MNTEDVDDELFQMPDDPKGKVRAYLVTINNYSEQEVELVEKYMNDKKRTRYCCIGWETAPTTGTPHIHVYFHWVSQVSFTQMKKKFPRADIRVCRGTPQQISDYCKKEGTFKEQGDLPKSGKRSDIDHIRDVLQETSKMADVVVCARSYQAVQVAEKYLQYHERPRNWKPIVKWYWGQSGSGKTHKAVQELGEHYYDAPHDGKWWQGYDAHENVLIDDMRETFMDWSKFLKLIDKNKFRVECKGSSRQFLARKIIITSPYPPEELYANREDKFQLVRRLDEIRHFSEIYIGDENNPDEETDILF